MNDRTPETLIRCAIYTRTSTEEGLSQEFNSLEAQRLACVHYIESQKQRGWHPLPDEYNDGGYSGGTIERPALERLLIDIEEKRVDLVIVYKIERFSRSMAQFVALNDVLKKHNVTFVSVTQHFDTSSIMGKLMLNVLLSFAEFERENAGERTRDKIAASKKRGMWLGGYAPLGYDIKNKKLVINNEEAETVRFIFAEFVKKRSYKRLAETLRAKEIKTKAHVWPKTGRRFGGNYFTTGMLERLINNPTYNGKVRHKKTTYDGQHEAIISEDVWQATRRILEEPAKERAGVTKRKIPALLTGLLKCGGCNSAMTPSATRNRHGKIYRYYVPVARQKASCVSCPIRQLSAPEIESTVLCQLQQALQTPELVVSAWHSVNQQGKTNASPR